jgi:ketosteroid isomerase-like protein
VLRKQDFLPLYFLMAVTGGAQRPPGAPDTRAHHEAAIKKANVEWVRVAQAKQVDAWVAFYSDDAALMPPNQPAATNKEDIRKAVAALAGLPGLSINWQVTKVEVARSGDIAYAYGTYDLSINGPDGKPISDHGKIVEAWKRRPDGVWKCSVDTWNSDLPATPPPSK